MRLLEAAHHESPRLGIDPFSEEQTTKTVMSILQRAAVDGGALGLICYLDGEAVACMGAMMCPQLTSETMVASELIIYVMPEHRGTRAGYLMIRAFEDWAKPYDMRAGSALGVDDDKAIDFYTRLGYEKIGVGVMKRGSTDG